MVPRATRTPPMPMMTSDGIGGNTFSIAIKRKMPKYPPHAIASTMNSYMLRSNECRLCRCRCPLGRDLSLDCVPDKPRGVRAVELVDGHCPVRHGHVNLRQPLPADRHDAAERQAAALELGHHGGADLFLARREVRRFGISPSCLIGPELARAGRAVDRAGDLAVDQHD